MLGNFILSGGPQNGLSLATLRAFLGFPNRRHGAPFCSGEYHSVLRFHPPRQLWSLSTWSCKTLVLQLTDPVALRLCFQTILFYFYLRGTTPYNPLQSNSRIGQFGLNRMVQQPCLACLASGTPLDDGAGRVFVPGSVTKS